jgi:ribose transport system permease protein
MPDLLQRVRTKPWAFAALLSAALLVANIVVEPSFGDPKNLPGELATLAPLALVALASTPAVLAGPGHLDLSIGPLAVLCNVLLVEGLMPHGLDSAGTAIPVLLVIGGLVGAINGVLVTILRFQSVIATLCSFFVVTGVTLKIGATPKTLPVHNWTTGLADQVGPLPGALLLLALPALIWWLLSRTAFHRTLLAVGSNDATAFSAGVDVHRTRIAAYALGGVFAGVAGVALTALVQSSQPDQGATYVLIALAAVALGGTQFTGGRGDLTGPFIGALALYLIQNLLAAADVPPNWLQIVYGTMLLAGVLVGASVQAGRLAGAVR